MEVPQVEQDKLIPKKIRKQVVSWTQFRDYDLFFLRNGNDSKTTWRYKRSNRRTSPSPLFGGYHVPKLCIYDVEGEGLIANVSMVANFGNLWTLQTVAYGESIKSWDGNRWMRVHELLGCPRKLCFDGPIDAAYRMDDDSVIFLVGRYSFRVHGDELSNGTHLSGLGYGHEDEWITAAANVFDPTSNRLTTIAFASTHRVLINGTTLVQKAHEVFKDLDETTEVDAAVGQGNQFILIVGRYHSVYTHDKGGFHLEISHDINTNRWSPIFKSIDAAYSNGSSVYFISGSFFLTSDTTNNQSELIQRNLFKCNEFTENAVIYHERFRPELEFRPFTNPNLWTSKATIAVIVLAVVLLVILILYAIIYFLKKKPPSLDEDIVTIDSNPNIQT